MRRTLLTLLAALLLAALYCASTSAQSGPSRTSPPESRKTGAPPAPPASGEIQVMAPIVPRSATYEGDRYVNRYFEISFVPPRGWQTVDGDQMKGGMNEVARVAAPDNDRMKGMLESSIERSIILLAATKYRPGIQGPYNAALTFVAELVPTALVKNGRDYLELMLHTFEQTQVKMEVTEPIHTVRVGGADFSALTVKTTFPTGGMAMQKYLTIIRKGYALGFTFTYLDEKDLQTFDQLVSTIKVQ